MYKHVAWAAIALLLGCAGLTPAAEEPGFKLVVNGSRSADALSREVVAALFLKKTKSWGDGSPACPADQAPTSPARRGFSRLALLRTVDAVQAYWNQQIFSGRDVPPPELRSDAAVLALVRGKPCAIGYVSAGVNVGPGVKVLRLDD